MKETRKKSSIFAKKSMFVALVGLCSIVVISLTMNLAIRKEAENQLEESQWEDSLQSSIVNQDSFSLEDAEVVNAATLPQALPEDNVSQDESQETTPDTETPDPTVIPKAFLMEKPVPGVITKDYSPEDLVYSDTMEDWRVHDGIDFAAEEKDEVKAAADGTIETISQDGLFGACLVISHPDGLQTFYGNLEENSMPELGTQVKTGQVIGRIGKTATVEINDASHLHFEVRKDGKSVNPHDYLADTVTDDE